MPRLIAASILLGSAMIAAAIYFGLRARPVAPPAPVAIAPAVNGAESSTQQVEAQLAAARPELARACWPAGTAGSATYRLDLTFGPDGGQLARGLLGDRRVRVPGVSQCVQSKLAPLHIAPTGSTVHLLAPLPLP